MSGDVRELIEIGFCLGVGLYLGAGATHHAMDLLSKLGSGLGFLTARGFRRIVGR